MTWIIIHLIGSSGKVILSYQIRDFSPKLIDIPPNSDIIGIQNTLSLYLIFEKEGLMKICS